MQKVEHWLYQWGAFLVSAKNDKLYREKVNWMTEFYGHKWISAYRNKGHWRTLVAEGTWVVVQSLEANGEAIDFLVPKPSED